MQSFIDRKNETTPTEDGWPFENEGDNELRDERS
jgi:hypothetical protein